jgi:hypothetical protein
VTLRQLAKEFAVFGAVLGYGVVVLVGLAVSTVRERVGGER